MAQQMREEEYDVVVVGGGCAGVAAATSAAKSGAKTLLLEAGSMIGGELTVAKNAGKGAYLLGIVFLTVGDEDFGMKPAAPASIMRRTSPGSSSPETTTCVAGANASDDTTPAEAAAGNGP